MLLTASIVNIMSGFSDIDPRFAAERVGLGG
jgi:hypothetical protein